MPRWHCHLTGILLLCCVYLLLTGLAKLSYLFIKFKLLKTHKGIYKFTLHVETAKQGYQYYLDMWEHELFDHHGNVETFSFYVTLKSIDMWKHKLGLTVQ